GRARATLRLPVQCSPYSGQAAARSTLAPPPPECIRDRPRPQQSHRDVRPALTRVPAVSPLPKPTPRRSCAYRRCCLRTLTRHPRELRLPVRRPITVQLSTRSEERRVGKECISRLTTVQYIKSVTLEMT